MIYLFETDQEILNKLVKKLTIKRKALKLTQKMLAEKAGVSFRTIQNLEKGENTTLLNFIAVLRALGELSSLSPLLADEVLSPKSIHERK